MFVQLCRMICGLLILCGCTALYADQNFISIADIHFNPFASCPLFSSSCEFIHELESADAKQWPALFKKQTGNVHIDYFMDTNDLLLQSSLIEIKKVVLEKHPDFVLILGDFLAHDLHKKYKKYAKDKSREGYYRFVRKILAYLTSEINAVFPDIDVYPVVGNNDSYTGNYSVIPHGRFFNEIAIDWSYFIKNSENRARFRNNFPTSGYYMIQRDNNHRIIVLNTVLFSTKSQTKRVKSAAIEQLNWLKMQLEDAKTHQQWVVLAYHIPIGVDLFNTFKIGFGTISEFWTRDDMQAFDAILTAYPTTVTAMLAGHIHIDAYQMLVLPSSIPLIYTPSISPIYGNNPGFKLIHYTPESFHLNHITLYSYPINRLHPAWQLEYGLNRVQSQPAELLPV